MVCGSFELLSLQEIKKELADNSAINKYALFFNKIIVRPEKF